MGTEKNRNRHHFDHLRYESDLTDAEWANVGPLIPPAKHDGNKRHGNLREVVNGIIYGLRTGCHCLAIPKDLPPRGTLFAYLDLWFHDGTRDRMHHALYEKRRERAGREANPTACIIDGHPSTNSG